jgi:hypothetical protein
LAGGRASRSGADSHLVIGFDLFEFAFRFRREASDIRYRQLRQAENAKDLEAPCNSLPFPGIRSMSGRVTYSGFLIPARQWEPRVPLPSTRLGVSHPLSSFYVGWGYTYLHTPLGSPEPCAFQGRPARLGVFHPVCRSRRLPRFFRHLVDELRERCSQNET